MLDQSSRPRSPKSVNANHGGAASCRWRVSLIRKRAKLLGYLDAPTREVEEAAASAFSLTAEQRKRLVIQERN